MAHSQQEISMSNSSDGRKAPCRASLLSLCFLLGLLVPAVLGSTVSRPQRTRVTQRARVCPSSDELDAGSRAYLAPVVFEGKARSKSDVHMGLYRVTFDVVNVLKGDMGSTSQVRLEFLLPSESHNWPKLRRKVNSSPAPIRHSNSLKAWRSCVVAADIRPSRRYLVYASQLGPNNFTAIGAPVPHSKKALKEIRATVCHQCARTPVAVGLDDVTVRSQGKLTLQCRSRGNPIPSLAWFKDGKPLQASKRIRIKTKRRRSTLRIRCVKEEDAGLYECRPSNVVGPGTPSRARVSVLRDSRPSLARPGNGSTSLWPLIALPCPIDSFCLNGGTCKYYEAVGELVCQCAEGYKGQRCENKDIYNLGKGIMCGGKMGGRRCLPDAGTPDGPLGLTAAASWAAVPSRLSWWHWLATELDQNDPSPRCDAD